VLLSHLKAKVLNALLEAHPYEEVAYDIYVLENDNVDFGLGCIGELETEMGTDDFLNLLKSVFDSKAIRYSGIKRKSLKKVALCGGSGASLISTAIASGAEAFVTADIKYHSFQDAGNNLLLIDIGHYESEKFAIEILYDLIIKKFPKFAVRFSETNSNPINYL
jgi:putative NIF3 family GTP cyclohydrolase 1 type 2